MVAGIVFVLILLYCLIVPIISPYDPNEVDFSISNEPPSLEHPFGTDKFGRDLFTRVALGGRVSILIAFGATLAILFIGVVYGSISGFVVSSTVTVKDEPDPLPSASTAVHCTVVSPISNWEPLTGRHVAVPPPSTAS